MADEIPNHLTQEQLQQLIKDQLEATAAHLKLSWNTIVFQVPEKDRMDLFKEISNTCDGKSNFCVLAANVHHLAALISSASPVPDQLLEVVVFALRHYVITNQANVPQPEQNPEVLAAMSEKPKILN